MLFYPMLLLILIGFIFFEHQHPGLLFAATTGLCAGLAAIPFIFYTYTALLGKNILILDILTFAFSVLLANVLSYVIMRSRMQPLPYILKQSLCHAEAAPYKHKISGRSAVT